MESSLLRRITTMRSLRPVDWLFLYAGLCMAFLPAIVHYYGVSEANGYLELADSMLEGRVSLNLEGSRADMISYANHYYLPHPPFPALILIPFVALFGKAGVNVGMIAVVISCISFRLAYDILVRLKTSFRLVPWLLGGFFFGTSYWYVASQGHSLYFFGHIVSICLQLFVVRELLGKARPWLVGLLIGASFLTRQFTIFYVVFAALYLIWQAREQGEPFAFKKLLTLFCFTGTIVLVYLWYNYIRFGSPLETGYGYILFNKDLKERVDLYGVFSPHYVLYNFYSLFLKGFNIEFTGPGMLQVKGMDPWGTSLICASPFLVLAYWSDWNRQLKFAAWITMGVMLLGSLFYHSNGFKQANAMRFSLDFLPILLLLLATVGDRIPIRILRLLVVYSVLLNIIALVITFLH